MPLFIESGLKFPNWGPSSSLSLDVVWLSGSDIYFYFFEIFFPLNFMMLSLQASSHRNHADKTRDTIWIISH